METLRRRWDLVFTGLISLNVMTAASTLWLGEQMSDTMNKTVALNEILNERQSDFRELERDLSGIGSLAYQILDDKGFDPVYLSGLLQTFQQKIDRLSSLVQDTNLSASNRQYATSTLEQLRITGRRIYSEYDSLKDSRLASATARRSLLRIQHLLFVSLDRIRTVQKSIESDQLANFKHQLGVARQFERLEMMLDCVLLVLMAAAARYAIYLNQQAKNLEKSSKLYHETYESLSQALHREDFIETIAHDLKTPLIGASRIIDIVVSGVMGPVTDQQRSILKQTKASLQDQLDRIKMLLEVCRNETTACRVLFVQTDISSLARATVSALEPIASERLVEIKLSVCQSPLYAEVDAQSVSRIMQNLLDNAVKHSPVGGMVEICVDRDESNVRFEIADNGGGLGLEDQERLFERFWQSVSQRRELAGTGLGLYLCHQLITAHAGTITCSSKPGEPTKFVVTLPLHQTDETGPESGQISREQDKSSLE